jgi:Flp pilus assembly protein TadG
MFLKSASKKSPEYRQNMTGLKAFLCDQGGGIAVFAALTLPVVAGLVGFGLDTSVWYAMKRDVRGMTDAAAHTKMQGGSASEILAAAITDATRNGYDSTACNDPSCLVLTEVASPFGNSTETIQIAIRQRAPIGFASFFID